MPTCHNEDTHSHRMACPLHDMNEKFERKQSEQVQAEGRSVGDPAAVEYRSQRTLRTATSGSDASWNSWGTTRASKSVEGREEASLRSTCSTHEQKRRAFNDRGGSASGGLSPRLCAFLCGSALLVQKGCVSAACVNLCPQLKTDSPRLQGP